MTWVRCATAGALAVQLAIGGNHTAGNDRAENSDVAVAADPDAFYRAVRENLARAQEAAHRFSYKERRSALRTNPLGKLGTDGDRLYHVYPAADPDLTYRRLLERDGVPLSEHQLAKQDREYCAKAARVRMRLEGESDRDRRRREEEDAAARARARAIVDDIVVSLEFSIRGRSAHEGRSAVLVAFEGRPESRPNTREGRIAQKFAGTIWIDAELHEVISVEAESTEGMAFGFGVVAHLSKGTAGSIERRPVDDDLWMPTELRVTGSGRAALYLRKLTVDYAIDWFDYRRNEPPTCGPQ